MRFFMAISPRLPENTNNLNIAVRHANKNELNPSINSPSSHANLNFFSIVQEKETNVRTIENATEDGTQ